MERHRIPRIHAIRTYKIFRFLQPQQENHGKSQKEQHQKKHDRQSDIVRTEASAVDSSDAIHLIIVFRSNTVSHICDLSKKVKFCINQVGVGWLYMRKQDITPYHTGRNIQVHVQRGKKKPKKPSNYSSPDIWHPQLT